MTAFDTDVLTELFAGNAALNQRLALVAASERRLPVVVAGEIVRGWLAAIRQAEAKRGRMTLEFAFARLEESLVKMAPFALLPYTAAAHDQVESWQRAKIRVGTDDMRIAAICVVHGAMLVTRNARDYAQLPGLTFEVWN
jgi:tRNA(fMet)-specific endonuclease VapC